MKSVNEIYLGVNIDHVATLRQARLGAYPDPIYAAMLAEEAGADGITIHLREDRRHIQERDVWLLKKTLQTRMNLELAVTETMLTFAAEVKPEHCCFVPEKREELTTEGGLDVYGQTEKIQDAVARLQASGIEVSLFIDADVRQVEASINTGAKALEIHTGHYAEARHPLQRQQALKKIIEAAELAHAAGMIVNAGHGLNYQNVKPVAAVALIHELNIGHSIIARAVMTGMKEAVGAMKQLLTEARYPGYAA